MVLRLATYIALAAALLRLAAALDASFTYPVQTGLIFYEQDTVNVSYVSDIDNPSLWFFCREGENDENVVAKRIISDARPKDGFELMLIDFGTTASQCWFNLRDDDDSSYLGPNSVGFSISASQRDSATLGLQGPATTSAGPTVSSATTSAASKTDKKSEPTEEPKDDGSSSGLSSGAKAGIGVGVAVVALAGIGAIIAFVMARRHKANEGVPKNLGVDGKPSNGNPSNNMQVDYNEAKNPEHGQKSHGPANEVVEIDSGARPQELAA